jgi:hypothetical protein
MIFTSSRGRDEMNDDKYQDRMGPYRYQLCLSQRQFDALRDFLNMGVSPDKEAIASLAADLNNGDVIELDPE